MVFEFCDILEFFGMLVKIFKFFVLVLVILNFFKFWGLEFFFLVSVLGGFVVGSGRVFIESRWELRSMYMKKLKNLFNSLK